MNINDNQKVKIIADEIFEIEDKLDAIYKVKDMMKMAVEVGMAAGKSAFDVVGDNVADVMKMAVEEASLTLQHKTAMDNLGIVAKEEMGIDFDFVIDPDGTIRDKKYANDDVKQVLTAMFEGTDEATRAKMIKDALKDKDCDNCDQKEKCPVRAMKEAYVMGASATDAAKLHGQKMGKC